MYGGTGSTDGGISHFKSVEATSIGFAFSCQRGVLNVVRKVVPLTDTTIRAAKPREDGGIWKLSDGDGLQLWVMPGGGKLWRLDYRIHGKRKLLAFGAYPEITLLQARKKAAEARGTVAQGHDPSTAKKAAKIAARAAGDQTFSALGARLVEKKRKERRAEITLSKMQWILGKVKSDIGSLQIQSITTPDIIAVLKKEEDAGNLETARRMRTVVGEVFRYAMQHGIVTADPVPATKGAIASPTARNHPAILDPKRFGHLLRLIDGYAEANVLTGLALQLMALLYPRPGELRQADWCEFDLENGRWTIPAGRMKMRVAHTKPLPRQAVAILERLRDITGPTGLVFPAVGKRNVPMSENTMNAALRRMGISGDEHVSHGFRSSASTMINDSNLFSADAIEKELAHQHTDAVRRAYRRGDAMEERVRMAQWWADRLDDLRTVQSAAETVATTA